MENLDSSDQEILETVLGQRIEFSLTPVQVNPPPQPNWSKTEGEFTDTEILKLHQNGVIICMRRANLFPQLFSLRI